MLGVWPKVVKIFEKLWEVLKAREIFQNWLSATIKYILWKSGILKTNCIEVKCASGGGVCIEPEFYGRIIRGYYHGYLKNVECNGDHIVLNGIRVLAKPRFNGRYWDFGFARFIRFRDVVLEEFIKQPYSLADYRERVVLDVGAYVGDSSIYFALRGAKNVYALEPHPIAYQEMVENIRLNGMEDKIIPINAALASKPGIVRINVDIEQTTGTLYKPQDFTEGVYKVNAMTLEQLINNYNIKPDILKMDCEGCEFDIVINDQEHIKLFKELIIEYHEDEKHHLIDILNILREEYNCRVIKEKESVGIMYCVKKR